MASTDVFDDIDIGESPEEIRGQEYLFSQPHPETDLIDESDITVDQPDVDIAASPKRGRIAKQYEKKTKTFLNVGFRMAVSHPATVPDAAALLMLGPDICEKTGDLAAHDVRVRKAIDFLTEGADNPYLALGMAIAPLFFQVVRNHEPVMEPATRGIKVPFTKKRLNLRFGVKLGKLRNFTNDPNALVSHAFSDPAVKAKLAEQGITIAGL